MNILQIDYTRIFIEWTLDFFWVVFSANICAILLIIFWLRGH